MGFHTHKRLPHSRLLLNFIIFVSLSVVPSRIASPVPDGMNESHDQKTLERILEKTGEYCERVKNIALFYVCTEKVADVRYSYRQSSLSWFSLFSVKPRIQKTSKKTYVYDYQLVKKGNEVREKRDLLEEDGQEKHQKNVEFRPVKYFGQYLVYGPVGFLSRYWQRRFDYKIIGEEVLDGKKTIVLESSPKVEREGNCNYGRIWVDSRDFSVLKIEYDPRSIKDYEDELLLHPIKGLSKKVVWTLTFGIEKNRVRFPSHQLVQEHYLNSKGKMVLMEEISFRYEGYKFFVVEVEVKY